MDIFGVGPMEVFLVLVLALIVLGPGKMPELARQLGKAVREFQRASKELMDALNSELAEQPKSDAASGENGRASLPERAGGAEVLARATVEEPAVGTGLVPAALPPPADRPKANPEPWLSGDFWGATPSQTEEPQAAKTEPAAVAEPSAPVTPSIPDPAVTLEFIPSTHVQPVPAAYLTVSEPVPAAHTEVEVAAPAEVATPEGLESAHAEIGANTAADEGDSRPGNASERRAATPRRRSQKTGESDSSAAAVEAVTAEENRGEGTAGHAPADPQTGEETVADGAEVRSAEASSGEGTGASGGGTSGGANFTNANAEAQAAGDAGSANSQPNARASLTGGRSPKAEDKLTVASDGC